LAPIVHEGRVSPEDSRREPYLYLPFEVPAGTTRVSARLEHDPGNVIDLGLLDSSATSFPSEQGFRGWSGGARDRFFVAMDDATPGYLPGVMPQGNWRVILGLYRIRPEGCRYRVEIELDAEPRRLVPTAGRHPSFAVSPGWYPGDLQSHTHHSDARGSLSDLVNAARARGLRFLAVTDHNTISHHRHLAEASNAELFLIPGEEVTTDHGHANVWGARDWVDFRITEPGHVDQVVERAHALGGLVSINHPKPGGPDWRYHVPSEVDCVEAWQAPWPARNEASLEFYDRLLREGRHLVLVGGSDRHQPGWPDPDPIELQVGSPTTWLWLEELSVAACLAALKSGRVFVSESPAGPRLELEVNGVAMGGSLTMAAAQPGRVRVRVDAAEETELRLVTGSGEAARRRLSAGQRTEEIELELTAATGFVRSELWHASEERVVALSNPVYYASSDSAARHQ
jgi:hypothetical protein